MDTKEKLDVVLASILETRKALGDLAKALGAEEEVQPKKRHTGRTYRKWSPEDRQTILAQADMAKELGRGALKTVLRKWNIGTGHLHNWQKQREQKSQQV